MYLIQMGLFWMREGAPSPQVRLPSSLTALALLSTFETILEALSEAPGPWHPRNPLRDPLCQLHVCVARNCLLALQAGGMQEQAGKSNSSESDTRELCRHEDNATPPPKCFLFWKIQLFVIRYLR